MRHVLSLILLFSCLSSCISKKTGVEQLSRAFHNVQKQKLVVNSDSLRSIGGFDRLLKNRYGNWELYIEGNSIERGEKIGLLTADLIHTQRQAFMHKLEEIVPSARRRKWIMKFVSWYNRDLHKHISPEYLEEIYALSTHIQDTLDLGGDKYHQTLYMHAAHDLGHALQDLAIVGCSSVASWGGKTQDGGLLLGRNFDFYLSDDFSKNKVIYFVKPDNGIPFLSISWAGMVGVVSGMNVEGLTVTMNAAKSTIPLKAKTPVSLIAREILQHASTIEEAIRIANTRKPFVSETLMIGSAKDNRAVLIEISPKKVAILDAVNQDQIICTNHFQTNEFKDDSRNRQHMMDSHSEYRYRRLEELLAPQNNLTASKMVAILRNKEGLNDQNIGLGNDKSLAHLMAHHAVVFQPHKQLVWVSNAPYQLGAFNAYDLKAIFSKKSSTGSSMLIDSLTITADPFVASESYAHYESYRKETERIEKLIQLKSDIAAEDLKKYQSLNPSLWYVYYLSGYYWMQNKDYEKAIDNFDQALQKEIPTRQAKEQVIRWRTKVVKKWKK